MQRVRNVLQESLQATFGADKVAFNGQFEGMPLLPNTCNFSLLIDGLHRKGGMLNLLTSSFQV
eukprot:m.133303 g.133303  ORF g.133303 m.133303 type:complete len:63 (-) comp9854_c0_seq1:279-467(-)